MPSLKDMRVRINSVKQTRKITSAMKLVAASKLKRAQEQAESSRPFAERMSAMLANLASLSLFVPILLAVSPGLLPVLWPELAAAGAVMLAGGLLGLRRGEDGDVPSPTAQTRMFRFGHALVFAAVIAAVLFVSAALNAWLGPRGAISAAVLAALAELHAAVATAVRQNIR